jgi:hypothetical protein
MYIICQMYVQEIIFFMSLAYRNKFSSVVKKADYQATKWLNFMIYFHFPPTNHFKIGFSCYKLNFNQGNTLINQMLKPFVGEIR